MTHLLNLLAAIALLVWGTHLVRKGILQVFGSKLRSVLGVGMKNRFTAMLSGFAVTALVQSSTATALIVSSFVGQGLVGLTPALAVMLGADIGTSVMAVLFSLDLSWLSPLFILVGVFLFVTRPDTTAGRVGRVLIGLGLMLLALRLVTNSTVVLTQSPAVKALLATLSSDLLLELLVGAMLVVFSYSSLAIVLLTATIAASGGVPIEVALGLVLGANLGSGLLAVITTAKSDIASRRVPMGNLLFKMVGVLIALPLLSFWLPLAQQYTKDPAQLVVILHLCFNLMVGLICITCTQWFAQFAEIILPDVKSAESKIARHHHLDPSALSTPSLAISCAAREAMYQAEVVETMLRGVLTVIKNDDLQLAEELRKMDDTVDTLYSSIKYYLTKISREALGDTESKRWTDIISFTINMEHIGDVIERILQDVETKKIKPGRHFSNAGMAEITELHKRLLDNLRLGMSVFLTGNVQDAQTLIEEKARFRDLEHQFAQSHLDRLSDKTLQSFETSSLHIDLISELKRINSHICSIAYPILDDAGILAHNRIKPYGK